jgi:hypothetical protein
LSEYNGRNEGAATTMTIVKFPSRPPSPDELALARVHLCRLLRDVNLELLVLQSELTNAGNVSDLATGVRRAADKLAEVSTVCAELSDTIRKSWRI